MSNVAVYTPLPEPGMTFDQITLLPDCTPPAEKLVATRLVCTG